MSLSAHKFHGPKGIGVLYAKRGTELTRLLEGGGQERGMRPGTENVPAIVGMAAALKEECSLIEEHTKRLAAMRDRLIRGLMQIPHCILNGPSGLRLPGNVNFCFEGVSGESLCFFWTVREFVLLPALPVLQGPWTQAMCFWHWGVRQRLHRDL